jgi:type II secretory pathway pseudopilin PulG
MPSSHSLALTRLRGSGVGCDEAGVTLVEVLVGMLVATALLTLASRGFLQNYRAVGQAQSRSEATVATQNALERITRDIRIADPSVTSTSTATTLTVPMYRSGGICSLRTYFVGLPNSGPANLVIPGAASVPSVVSTTVTDNTTVCPTSGGTSSNRLVLADVPAGLAPFTYLGSGGTAVGSVTNAVSVEVRLIKRSTGAQDVDLRTVAQLRNKR